MIRKVAFVLLIVFGAAGLLRLGLDAYVYVSSAHAAITRGNAAFVWLAEKDAAGKTRAERLEALLPPSAPAAK